MIDQIPVIPEWMTGQQVDAVFKLFRRSPDGSDSPRDFFLRVYSYGDYCGLSWCGMFVGIEKDGHTHT